MLKNVIFNFYILFFDKGKIKMEKYHNLKVYSFNHPGKDELNKEIIKRKDSYSTITTNLIINPMKRDERLYGKKYNLFLVPIPELTKLRLEIEDNSKLITKIVNELPPIASSHFFLRMLIEEIKSTNNIEGVKTTRLEIKEAIQHAEDHSRKKVRLQSFVNMYLKIQNGDSLKINSIEDVRTIYDFLLAEEIDSKNKPDGKYFRNSYVYVGNDSQIYYIPKDNELDIIEDLQKWINFINRKDIDYLTKAAISHYYFECIHPFFDGNGRTGRYIFCSYVGKKLDPYTAVSFSHEIDKNRSKYYKAFRDTNDDKNYGEITFFVIAIFEYLVNGQKDVLKRLEVSKNRLLYVEEKLNSMENDFSKNEQAILYVYFQAYLFNDITDGIEDNLVKNLFKTEQQIPKKRTREIIDNLTKKEMLSIVKRRPLIRKISPKLINYFELN